MRVPAIFVAPLSAALLAAGLAASGAQEVSPGDGLAPIEPPPVEQAPPIEPESEAEPPEGAFAGPSAANETDGAEAEDGEAVEQTHLDALFAELADPANQRWQATQAQIYAAWSRSGSASMDLLARRADAAMEAREMDVALSFLNDLVRLAPDYAEGWNKRATIHFLRDEYGRSLRDIARVLALEPRHFGAYAGLGIILDRLGDKKGALEAYRRAIDIHPNLPGAADGMRKLTREVEGERT